jgi:branched-chain amino acid transport system ATP-binding protein
MDERTLFRADGVAVNYGRIEALAPISLSAARGSLTLVLGANGAGKTTLVKALAGAVALRAGRVVLDGVDITYVPAYRRVTRGVSLVPEGRGRLPGLNVRDNLILGWDAAARTRRGRFGPDLDDVLELFPVLRERFEQDCNTLSGGEMQMLAIARALLAKPLVLLLDEPSLGLAPLAVARVYDALERLLERGLCMIVVEQKSVPLGSDRETTIVLQNGHVVFQEARRPDDDQLAALYLGMAESR